MVERKTKIKKEETTTICLDKDLVPLLKAQGHMGDTYSTVIRRLLTGNGKKPSERGIAGRDE